MAEQDPVIAFLADRHTYPGLSEPVARRETHGAFIFLAGETALKMKRAVRYSYLDFSTPERRRAALEREFEINRPAAPEIYRDVVPVTREANGGLALAGAGVPVEWVLRMRRFAEQDILSARADQAPLGAPVAKALADAVYASHQRSPIVAGHDTAGQMREIAREVADALVAFPIGVEDERAARLRAAAEDDIVRIAGVLAARAAAGFVRRCHGDLHLGNIVLWKGEPVLFDALEFDEQLATIDTLYDLAFLLMDLEHRDRSPDANLVLNRYLWRSGARLDLDGLAALPLFLALRAGVRAMVSAQRGALVTGETAAAQSAAAGRYLDAALAHLASAPCRLVAVGGFSGTGKSTLAAALAPFVGRSPGALHLRTDLERKSLFGVAETERLPPETYTPESARKVYAVVTEKAEATLRAGQSVIVDAVHAAPEERTAIEALAARLGVRFVGFWLEAAPEVLMERVVARTADASDATAAVLTRQLASDVGTIDWLRVDSDRSPEETLRAVLAHISASERT